MFPELDIDLDLPPDRRWEALADWRAGARALLEFYVRDIGGLESFAPLLASYRDAFVDPEYAAEMRGVARVLDARERFDRASSLLGAPMRSANACLDVLRDPDVKMGITVQHIVMSAATGEVRVELPAQ